MGRVRRGFWAQRLTSSAHVINVVICPYDLLLHGGMLLLVEIMSVTGRGTQGDLLHIRYVPGT